MSPARATTGTTGAAAGEAAGVAGDLDAVVGAAVDTGAAGGCGAGLAGVGIFGVGACELVLACGDPNNAGVVAEAGGFAAAA